MIIIYIENNIKILYNTSAIKIWRDKMIEKINELDLNLYKTFLAVANTGSVSKAAQILYVSQPAVSYSIKTLENNLNCRLFIRTGKGVELTAEGNKLLVYVEDACNTLFTGQRMLNESTDMLVGDINIGFPTYIGTFLVTKYIQKFSECYPGIKFHIINKHTSEMVDLLEKRKIDILIDNYPIFSEKDKISIYELYEVDNCLVGNTKYKELFEQERVSVEDIKDYPLLLPNAGTSTRAALEECARGKIEKFEPFIEVPTTEVMLDLVKRGIGIGYFAEPSVETEIQQGVLYKMPVDILLPKTKICIAYIDDFLTGAPRSFVRMIKDDIQRLTKKELFILSQGQFYKNENK